MKRKDWNVGAERKQVSCVQAREAVLGYAVVDRGVNQNKQVLPEKIPESDSTNSKYPSLNYAR